MARFYALLANGGKLVDAAPRRGRRAVRRRQVAAARPAPLRPPAAAAGRRSTRPRSRSSRTASTQATHAANGTSSGVFGNFPIPIAGKTGTAEKVNCRATAGKLDQSWWCGYGPRTTSRRSSSARHRERRPRRRRGGAGGAQGLPAVLRASRHRRPRPATRLMIEAVDTRARGPAPAPARGARLGAFVRAGSTGSCSPRSRARRLRALGDRRDHALRLPGEPGDIIARRSTRRSAASVSSRVLLVDPDSTAATGADLHRDARGDAARAARRPRLAPLEAVARPRLLPLPAVRVREAAVRPLLAASSPTGRGGARPHRRSRRSGSARADPARLRPAGHRHGAGLRGRARRGALRGRHALDAPRRARRRTVVAASLAVLWSLPAAGVHVLKPYQEQRFTGFTHPLGPDRRDLQRAPVDQRRRRRRLPAAARRRDADEARTSCPSTPPTSRSPPWPSSAASSASRSCCCSTCSSSGEA